MHKTWGVFLLPLAVPGILILWQHSLQDMTYTLIYRWVLLMGLLFAVVFLRSSFSLWLWGYFIANALIFSTLPVYQEVDPRIQQGLHLSAAYTLIILCLVPLFLSAVRQVKLTWYYALAIVSLILSFAVIFSPVPKLIVNLTWYPSMTGTFIAIVMVGMSGVWLLPGVVALLLIKSFTPLAALAAGLAVRSLFGRHKWLALMSAPILGFGIFTCLYKWSEGGSGRFPIWRLAYKMWAESGRLGRPFGFGLGSTPVLVPLRQVSQGTGVNSDQFYFFLHNDWLQLLYESGSVGFACGFILWFGALYRSRFDPKWCGMLVAYAVAMVTNFPLHWPLTAFLGVVLMGGAYARD